MDKSAALVKTLIETTRKGKLPWVRNAMGRFEVRVWECLFELDMKGNHQGPVLSVSDSRSNFSVPICAGSALQLLEDVICQSNRSFGQQRDLELIELATTRVTNIEWSGQYSPHERGSV